MDKYALAKLVDWSGPGGLAGRKRLQKVVYFLQHVGLPCGAEYTLHHYGPYSRDVAEACDELVALGLLTERSESVGPGEGPRYTYELAPPGVAALAQADRQPGSGAARISGFQPVAQNLVGRDLWELELGSTILYFHGKTGNWPDAVRRACEFKRVDPRSATVGPAESLAKWADSQAKR